MGGWDMSRGEEEARGVSPCLFQNRLCFVSINRLWFVSIIKKSACEADGNWYT